MNALRCKNEKCREFITKQSSSGYCRPCAIRASTANSGKKCKCGRSIRKSNKSGVCVFCNRYKPPREYEFGKEDPWFLTKTATCWNKYCGKKFYVSRNKHPKFTLCPACKEIRQELGAGNRITQGNYEI